MKKSFIINMVIGAAVIIAGCSNSGIPTQVLPESEVIYRLDDMNDFARETIGMIWEMDERALERMSGSEAKDYYQQLLKHPEAAAAWQKLSRNNEVIILESELDSKYNNYREKMSDQNNIPAIILVADMTWPDQGLEHKMTAETTISIIANDNFEFKLAMTEKQLNDLIGVGHFDRLLEGETLEELYPDLTIQANSQQQSELERQEYFQEIKTLINGGNVIEALQQHAEHLSSPHYLEIIAAYRVLPKEEQARIATILAETSQIGTIDAASDATIERLGYTAYRPFEYWTGMFHQLSGEQQLTLSESVLLFNRYVSLSEQKGSFWEVVEGETFYLPELYRALDYFMQDYQGL